ncbi:MAG: transcription termination/antitermination protein NusG [Candidatus Hydrogenedentota bacterium]
MLKKWYVIHTYAGYENKVKSNLERRIQSLGMEDKIFRILIPTEEIAEMRDGEKVITEKKFFPGYVLVEMEMDDESWAVVRNTPGVTNFVGPGIKPTALDEDEVKETLKNAGLIDGRPKPKPKVRYASGDKVKVIDGPFKDFIGSVEAVELDRNKLKVMMTIFGRATPVELDFLQVEKV